MSQSRVYTCRNLQIQAACQTLDTNIEDEIQCARKPQN